MNERNNNRAFKPVSAIKGINANAIKQEYIQGANNNMGMSSYQPSAHGFQPYVPPGQSQPRSNQQMEFNLNLNMNPNKGPKSRGEGSESHHESNKRNPAKKDITRMSISHKYKNDGQGDDDDDEDEGDKESEDEDCKFLYISFYFNKYLTILETQNNN